jgi:D-glycero-alpha-D-manno-heptose-7-phosphate kinase
MNMHPDLSPIRATSPLRISFVGGGTDFPHYYEDHGGAVLSATIDLRVRVTIRPRLDRQVTVRSLDLGHLVEYHLDEGPEYDGVMDLAKAAIDRVGVAGGIDVAIRSDAPAGSGLGGSSSLVVAMVAALAALGGIPMTADRLARLSYSIEREDLGISGGSQDQYAAAFGGFNLIEFDREAVRVTPVRLAPSTLAELEAKLLLCYTGSVRRNVGIIERQIALWREGREETRMGLKELHELAYVMRDAVEAGDADALGARLHDAFESKMRMNPSITEHTGVERMLELAREAGAAGGKMCGAGGGGYLLLYCAPAVRARVRARLVEVGCQFAPFRFHPHGVRAIRGSDVWTPSV